MRRIGSFHEDGEVQTRRAAADDIDFHKYYWPGAVARPSGRARSRSAHQALPDGRATATPSAAGWQSRSFVFQKYLRRFSKHARHDTNAQPRYREPNLIPR